MLGLGIRVKGFGLGFQVGGSFPLQDSGFCYTRKLLRHLLFRPPRELDLFCSPAEAQGVGQVSLVA